MSLEYIRTYYNVPARLRGRVEYTGNGKSQQGTIVGASGAHLEIRLDGTEEALPFHPTWKLRYLSKDETVPTGGAQ